MTRRSLEALVAAALLLLSPLAACDADQAQQEGQDTTSAQGDLDAGDDDVPTDDVPVVRHSPPSGDRAACEADGWDWIYDVATHYCPGGGGADTGDGCPEPDLYCFCTQRCETDDDCAGTTLPYCRPLRLFDYSDAGSCSDDVKVCTSDTSECTDGGSEIARTCGYSVQ